LLAAPKNAGSAKRHQFLVVGKPCLSTARLRLVAAKVRQRAGQMVDA
jgi:hypothetical protein